MNFKVTYKRHDTSSKISVWVESPTNEQAYQEALNEKQVRDFLAGYDGFYDISIISQQTLEESKLQMFPKLSFN